MKKITAIEVQKNKPDRVNIHLDGEFAFGLTRIVAAWLKVGQELSEEKIERLQAEEARERAYQQAMLFLSYRARSESEIRQNLRKHSMSESIIEVTLERLKQEGLANDNDFAQSWVENRTAFRPRSKRALTTELKQKGLTETAIRAATEAVDDKNLAYKAGRKRSLRYENLEWPEFRKKMSAFLARRGFSYAVIAPVVSRIWNEQHAEQPQIIDDEETL